jgi:hypothetical protein
MPERLSLELSWRKNLGNSHKLNRKIPLCATGRLARPPLRPPMPFGIRCAQRLPLRLRPWVIGSSVKGSTTFKNGIRGKMYSSFLISVQLRQPFNDFAFQKDAMI